MDTPKSGNRVNDSGFRIVRQGEAPVCIKLGRIVCRGCPGWHSMKHAALQPGSMWKHYPIHCPATGLTVISNE